MRKTRQAAQRRETKDKAFLIFANMEQFVGFLFFITIMLLSLWIIFTVKSWVDNPERVVLSQLTLTGDKGFTTEEDIQKAILGLGLPNTYIAQDVNDIRQEIMRLPWIKQVSVRKQWPDRLIVNIVENQPKYIWNDIFLLDKDGMVFSIPKDRVNTDYMPKLFGPIGKEKLILDMYHQLDEISINSANADLSLSIVEAMADERNSWQLIVKPCIRKVCIDGQNILLKLGREMPVKQYERFIRFFADIKANLPVDERLSEIDLRYENGIAVKKQKIEND